MKILVLTILLLLMLGCVTKPYVDQYPHEQCIDADIVCVDGHRTRNETTYTPIDPKDNNMLIWWFDVEFEILTPNEYAGKKIVFPIEPGKGKRGQAWLFAVAKGGARVCHVGDARNQAGKSTSRRGQTLGTSRRGQARAMGVRVNIQR